MASAAEADDGVARKKRVADRQITKDDNLAEADSDGGSGEGGTWKKAPDEVIASRKIVKARRPGQGAAGAPAAAANPFANVKLVAPSLPSAGEEKKPPPVAAAAATVKAAGDQVNVSAAAAVTAAGELTPAAANIEDGKGSNEKKTALQTEGKDGDGVEKTKGGMKEVVEENGNQRHENANGLEAGEKKEKKEECKTSGNEGKGGAGGGEDTAKGGREEANDDEKEEEGESGESLRKDAQHVAGNTASGAPPPPQSASLLFGSSSFAASSPFASAASAGSSPAFAGFSFASSSAFGVAGQSFPPLSSIFGGKRDEKLTPAAAASSTPFSLFGPSSSAITTSGAPSSSSGGVGMGTGLLSSAGGVAGGGGGGIVNLSEQHMETGEEEETAVFSGAAVLFEYMDGKSWKERGRGDLRLNVPKNESQRPRLVMRSKGNLRLLMNAGIFPDMKVTKMDGRGVTFVCVNTAAASGGGAGTAKAGGLATYAVRLADANLASSFLSLMEENKLRARNSPALTPSGKRPLEQQTEGEGGEKEKEQSGSKRPATEEKSGVGGGGVDVANDATKVVVAVSAGTKSSIDDQKTREKQQEVEQQQQQQKERENVKTDVKTDRQGEDAGKGEEAV